MSPYLGIDALSLKALRQCQWKESGALRQIYHTQQRGSQSMELVVSPKVGAGTLRIWVEEMLGAVSSIPKHTGIYS